MRKAFKFRICPTKATQESLLWTFERCRDLYNAALTERRDAYNFHVRHNPGYYDLDTRKRLTSELTVSYNSQQNDLPFIKNELREEYKERAAHVLQDVLRRLDLAFQGFYKRVQKGQEPGYPRFKGHNRYDSITYPDGAGWKFDGRSLHLSKIGPANVRLHRPLEGTIKTCTMKREVDQWYVIFSCEGKEAEKLPVSSEDVGRDVGVSHLATLSNGEMIEHPYCARKGEAKLQQAQQALSRKKRGSNRHKKAVKKVAKAHHTIANQRRDFLHKASRQRVNRSHVLVFEDIKPANVSRKPKTKKDEQTGQYVPNGAAAKGG